MKNQYFKLFSLLLVLIVAFSFLPGCGQGNQDKTASETGAAQNQPTQTTPAFTGPITVYKALDTSLATRYKSLGDTPFFQELQKETGVKVQFVQPSTGTQEQADQAFNLMLASRDFPDVICHDWTSYPGGPAKAISDGIIIPLGDMIDKNCPNLKNVLTGNPQADKEVKTDDGVYYIFPDLQLAPELLIYFGPQVRKDWLDSLNMQVPETMDDWTAMLRAFKEKKNATAGLTFRTMNVLGNNSAFVGAYGIGYEFYVDNGKMKYGPAEPAFKDFLKIFNQWYTEGLLDSDFATNDSKTYEAKITGGQSGAYLGYLGSGLGAFMDTMQATDPNVKLIGVQYPVQNKGETPRFCQKAFANLPNQSMSISTSNKHPDETAKWLDYGYSEKGNLLMNFGIEGASYTMKDGKPTYTDLITHNPNGLTMTQALAEYAMASYGWPMVVSKGYIEQYFSRPEQIQAAQLWAKCDDSTRVPPITNNDGENDQIVAKLNDIETYKDEMILKFIMGQVSIDEQFQAFEDNLVKMGIKDVLALKQEALDRFNSR